MNTDYEYLASSLASLAGIPVRLYRNEKFCGLYHHTKFKPDLAILEEEKIFRNEGSVSYYMDENFLYYGLFRVKNAEAALLVGPVAQIPVTKTSASRILRAMGEPVGRSKELADYFSTMPAYPLRTFLQILCTINYFINEEKIKNIEKEIERCEKTVIPPSDAVNALLFENASTKISTGIKLAELLRRPELNYEILEKIDTGRPVLSRSIVRGVEIRIKYEGYIKREMAEVEKQKKLENMHLSQDIDYSKILGLRLEAAEKLSKIKPLNIGQASRISGVNPADISVLIIYLSQKGVRGV